MDVLCSSADVETPGAEGLTGGAQERAGMSAPLKVGIDSQVSDEMVADEPLWGP